MFTFFWDFIYFQPLPPSPLQTTPPYSHPPPIQYTPLRVVSSLTIHPFINQLMSNGIVKPFLHKKTPVLYPLSLQNWSLPLCDLRHDLYSNSEPDSQPTNYKCGILPGRTDPFRIAPLPVPHCLPPPCHSGSSICLSKTHQSHPIPSLPPY